MIVTKMDRLSTKHQLFEFFDSLWSLEANGEVCFFYFEFSPPPPANGFYDVAICKNDNDLDTSKQTVIIVILSIIIVLYGLNGPRNVKMSWHTKKKK